jgi:hypothetical protein
VNAKARQALKVIQACVASGRYRVLAHFTRRMDQRGLFWPDIACVIFSPSDVQDDSMDDFGRPKWKVTGKTSDGLRLEIICAMDRNKQGNLTVFITVYWK